MIIVMVNIAGLFCCGNVAQIACKYQEVQFLSIVWS